MDISTDAFSLFTTYSLAQRDLATSMRRVASGDPFSVSGVEPGSRISMSNSLKSMIRSSKASTQNLKSAITYVNTADSFLRNTYDLVNRMTELAASATDPFKNSGDRQALDQEYQSLKNELSSMARNLTYQDMQTVGREVMVTYDDSTDKVTFYQPTGIGKNALPQSFRTSAVDVSGSLIGFDKDRDFTMDRDGEILYFIGTDSSGNNRLKSYHINQERIYSSAEIYGQDDKLFVDESGDLYVNNGGSLKLIDNNTLQVKSTISSDLNSGINFSVYNDVATYQRNDDALVTYNINTSSQATLFTTAQISSGFSQGGVSQAISASGEFVADESEDGKIRIIATSPNSSGNLSEFVLDVGSANNVAHLQFSEDGDRIYFVDEAGNSIRYANVNKDFNGNVSLTLGQKVVQGKSNSINGLDLGGVNPFSNFKFVLSEDQAQVLKYEAADLRLYSLGLANTNIKSVSDASSNLEKLMEATNRINFERSKFGGIGTKFKFAEQGHIDFLANAADFDSFISNVDVAEEVAKMQALQIQSQVTEAMIAQMNASQSNILQLLR